MTDIGQALAEALRHVDGPDPDLDGKPSDDMTNGEFAAALAATEPMQAIARDAAVGRAVGDVRPYLAHFLLPNPCAFYRGGECDCGKADLDAAIAAAISR